MKTKSFKKYLEKRLSKEEIDEISAQAELEVRILESFQKLITGSMDDYMKDNNIGFNELVRKLDWSPSKVAKIRRGESNLTLTGLAHLLALLDKDPKDVLRIKK